MTPSVLGLDISSFALHGCLLIEGQPPTLRMETLGKATDPLIERLREVNVAISDLTDMHGGGWNGTYYYSLPPSPTWVVLEDAFGRNRNADRALNRTIGAIVASVPSESQIAIVSSGDWRRAIGASKNTKQAGHDAVLRQLVAQRDYDEHELDAAGIALAWARILDGQVGA